jgi:quercetin dioxygenase-like cupin family protein
LTALLVSSIAVASAVEQATSVPYSPPALSEPLRSTFVDWDSLRFKVTPAGLYCAVFDQPTSALDKIEVHVTSLLPGIASHTPHHHPWEELLLIKDGQVEVSINGKTQTAGVGALVFIASHDVHNVTNNGKVPAVYYVINFVTDAVNTVRNQPAAEWAPAPLLSSRVVDCEKIPVPANGGHREVFDAPTLTFLRLESHVSTLAAGKSTTPRNRDPGDELFVVKSGVLEATLNGVACRLSAGSLFYVAPNDERTMKNFGTEACSYQVIKVVSDKSPH